jgi:hypothetical protein
MAFMPGSSFFRRLCSRGNRRANAGRYYEAQIGETIERADLRVERCMRD